MVRPARSAPAGTVLAAVLGVTVLAATAGCRPGGQPAAHRAGQPPQTEQPCADMSPRPSPGPSPLQTKLAWRSETMGDGSTRMTVGDIDAAPKAADAVRVADYRAPGSASACQEVRIVTVHGWWCTTTVSPVTESGEIVVGGATPRAHLRSAGFRTHCSGRTARLRQHYEVQRDSWSGWRPYSSRARTAWTGAQDQPGVPVTVLCPQGRVGSYHYRLGVAVEIAGLPALADSTAASPEIRTDCGTGVS